jgi:23S rRNA (uridine2552-2'-O)-methyltransferase
VADAKRLGLRSRAAFKLMDIDDRFHLLRPARRVIDLGAAPGGWTQVAVNRVRPQTSGGRVVALDITAVDPVSGAVILTMDIADSGALAALQEALEGPADVVLSDMSPAASGHTQTDHLRIMGLAEAALDLAESALAPGGAFVVKVFHGGADSELLGRLKRLFTQVKHVKPPASRKESKEIYVVATGFRPA